MADAERGYVDYFAVLGVDADAKPGEIRNQYKKRMKDLLIDISQVKITEELRDRFLLQIAQLNAAFFILRDAATRDRYVEDRQRVMALEDAWRQVPEGDLAESDRLRRSFDTALRHFLSTYMEERMLEAGRDAECVEASHWDLAHERHATRILRHFRQRLYHEIQERLPFYEVTTPVVDWEERARAVGRLIAAEG
jgi:curved DNA-binding protein CbpA